MSYRVLINGVSGKMGQLAAEVINSLDDFELVAGCGRHDNLAEKINAYQAHIVLDFTSAEVVYQNALTIINAGARPIIGTSGLLQSQVDDLTEKAQLQGVGGIIVPNFSIAAVLMMQCAAMTASFFKQIEIVEMHHERKLDAPSGTAIRTAELLQGKKQMVVPLQEIERFSGARGANVADVQIHSLRMPGIMARQQVIMGNPGETFTVEYNTIDRKAYIAGIRLACQRVMQLEQLFYGLEHLLGINYGE